MIIVLVDCNILVIIRWPLRITLIIIFGELYTFYFSYEIFISNSLQNIRNKMRI